MLYWGKNIADGLRQSDGWKLAVKGLAAVITIWTVLEGIRVYQEGHLSRARDQAQQDYQSILTRIGSDSSLVKAGAIEAIPELMRRQVPISDQISFGRSIGIALGISVPRRATYHNQLRDLILNILRDPRDSSKTAEIAALISVLETLGAEGWYMGEPRSEPDPLQELSWIWISQISKTYCPAHIGVQNRLGTKYCAYGLLRGAILPGVELPAKLLPEADLRDAVLAGADFREAVFSRATMAKVDLRNANLIEAQFEQASIARANLRNAVASLANFSGADLREAVLDHCDLRGANLQGANLSGASLRGVRMAGADLRNADLGDAIITDADATGADLRGANVRHGNFDGSNLSSVLVEGVLAWQKIKSMKNTNIAGIRDIPMADIEFAVNRGAVQINSIEDWHRFRAGGLPSKKRRIFNGSNRTNMAEQIRRAE